MSGTKMRQKRQYKKKHNNSLNCLCKEIMIHFSNIFKIKKLLVLDIKKQEWIFWKKKILNDKKFLKNMIFLLFLEEI